MNVLQLEPIVNTPSGILGLIEQNPMIPVLLASSPIVFSNQQIPDDYDTTKILTLGFVFAKAQPLPENVEAFLSTNVDSPVMYMGFGSMPTGNPMALIHLAIKVCTSLECRAIVVAGWSCLSSDECQSLLKENEKTILVVPSISHTALFPRMAAIVHHAGIGTTAAALRSGVPQLPCPLAFDQPQNAAMVKRLGVAPTTIPFASITADKLIKGLELILQDAKSERTIQSRAKEAGRHIVGESEKCSECTCDLIDNLPSTSWAKGS